MISLSPDLNPFENVGGMIKKISKKSTSQKVITSNDQLWEEVQNAYNTLLNDRQFFMNLAQSIPDRLFEVRNAQGRYTKYWIFCYLEILNKVHFDNYRQFYFYSIPNFTLV